jgi:hypothetical protein
MMVVSVSVAATVRMPVSMPFCGIRAIVFQAMLMHVFVVIATAIRGRHLLRILLLLLIQPRSLIQDEFLSDCSIHAHHAQDIKADNDRKSSVTHFAVVFFMGILV